MSQFVNTCRAALLTPSAPAGLAVIRLSGPAAQAVLKDIFRPAAESLEASQTPGRVTMGRIYDSRADETLDQVVVTVDSPRQQAEIHCHGGSRVIQRIMLLLQRLGVTICHWRDILPAQSIRDEIAYHLPDAKTPLGVLALASQHPGGLTAWVEKTIDALQHSPTNFPGVQNEIQKLLLTWPKAQRLLNPARVVLTGPANAGKSTLANALSGQTQSLTSDLPGTTRDWTANTLDFAGLPITLIDTAGLKTDYDDLEKLAWQQAEKQIRQADLVLMVVEPTNTPQHIEHWLAPLNLTAPPLIVVNKIDVTAVPQHKSEYLYISALTGQNLAALKTAVVQRLGFADFSESDPLVFTARQKDLLEQAVKAPSAQTVIAVLNRMPGSDSPQPNTKIKD